MNFFNNIPPVTKNIIIINVIVYLIQQTIPSFNGNFALHFFMSPDFKPYQLLTHMFMHGSFSHILFNMFGVFMFGSALEYRLGPQKFFMYFLMTGFGAVILHFLSMYWEGYDAIQQIEAAYSSGVISDIEYSNYYYNVFSITVGASGAIFGLLAGFGTLFPEQRIMLLFPPIPMKAKHFVLIYAAIELYLGFSNQGDNIAHFAHLGGALFGYLIIKAWRKKGII